MKLLKICISCCRQRTGTITVGLLDLAAHIFLLRYAIVNPNPGDSLIPIFQTNELLICFYTTSMITVVLLILGTFKGNMWLIIPWMGFKMTAIISLPVHIAYILIVFTKDYIFFSLAKIWAGLFVLAMAILIIFVLIVARYFNEVTTGKIHIDTEVDNQGVPLTVVKAPNGTDEQGIILSEVKAQNETDGQEILITESANEVKKHISSNHTFF